MRPLSIAEHRQLARDIGDGVTYLAQLHTVLGDRYGKSAEATRATKLAAKNLIALQGVMARRLGRDWPDAEHQGIYFPDEEARR